MLKRATFVFLTGTLMLGTLATSAQATRSVSSADSSMDKCAKWVVRANSGSVRLTPEQQRAISDTNDGNSVFSNDSLADESDDAIQSFCSEATGLGFVGNDGSVPPTGLRVLQLCPNGELTPKLTASVDAFVQEIMAAMTPKGKKEAEESAKFVAQLNQSVYKDDLMRYGRKRADALRVQRARFENDRRVVCGGLARYLGPESPLSKLRER